MKAAGLAMALCLLAGCSLFKPAANVAFTVEPGTRAEDPNALAAALRGRLEGMGAPSGEIVVKGRTVEVRTHLKEPDTAIKRLLRPFHVEFALADDAQLVALSGAILGAHPALTSETVYGEVSGATPCSNDRAALEKALAGTVVTDRRWHVEARRPYDARPAEQTLYCAVLLEPTVLSNEDIKAAEAFPNEFGNDMVVKVSFSAKAGQQFASMTRKAVKRRLAIVLDGDVLSLPVIQEEIGGGRAHITMGHEPDSHDEAVALAAALGTKPLRSAPKLLSIKLIGGN